MYKNVESSKVQFCVVYNENERCIKRNSSMLESFILKNESLNLT